MVKQITDVLEYLFEHLSTNDLQILLTVTNKQIDGLDRITRNRNFCDIPASKYYEALGVAKLSKESILQVLDSRGMVQR
jgi:hypothetical protein